MTDGHRYGSQAREPHPAPRRKPLATNIDETQTPTHQTYKCMLSILMLSKLIRDCEDIGQLLPC